jgi:hypothetical protein
MDQELKKIGVKLPQTSPTTYVRNVSPSLSPGNSGREMERSGSGGRKPTLGRRSSSDVGHFRKQSLERSDSVRRQERMEDYMSHRVSEKDHTGYLKQYVKLGNRVFDFVQTKWVFPFVFLHLNTFFGLGIVAAETYPFSRTVIEHLQWANFFIYVTEFGLRVIAETTRPMMVLFNPDGLWRRFDLLLIIVTCPAFPALSPLRVFMVFRLVDHAYHFHKVRVLFYGIAGGVKQTISIVANVSSLLTNQLTVLQVQTQPQSVHCFCSCAGMHYPLHLLHHWCEFVCCQRSISFLKHSARFGNIVHNW